VNPGPQTKRPTGPNCTEAPPVPPQAPPGANLITNIKIAFVLGQFGNSIWLAMVLPHSVWDYKSRFGQQFAAFGNFNYGATCFAAGLSETACQRGAGAAAYGTSIVNAAFGGRWTAGPGDPIGRAGVDPSTGGPIYGDQPGSTENGAVVSGWTFANWFFHCG